jgi:predicted RNA-binding Zn ribbon-like protein
MTAVPDAFELVGGWQCLDYANTVEPRHGQVVRDHLNRYPDVVAWAGQAGALDDDTHAGELLLVAEADPDAARRHFAAAITLREAVFAVFAAVAGGKTPAQADLDTVHRTYAAAAAHASLVPTTGGYTWAWPRTAFDRPVWAIARSAVDLLTGGPLERVKMCPTDLGCAWLFLDATKNRSRRWCSMDTCGAAVKASRQTARRRARRSP